MDGRTLRNWWTLLNKQLLLTNPLAPQYKIDNESDQPVLRDSEPIENLLRHYGMDVRNGGHK